MVTLTSTSNIQSQCSAPARLSFVTVLRRAIELHRSRHALARLSAAQLADIGLSVEEATREAARPVWDAPSHWYS